MFSLSVMFSVGEVIAFAHCCLELLEPHITGSIWRSKRFFHWWGPFLLQQFAGINAVLYFSFLTFKDVSIRSGLASLFAGLTNFAGTLLALNLIDKQGRQKRLIGSY
ncbi:Major facilitator superfamily protein [Thalictrum thalictroides]|uniref:Major facilitator superfamily protein n=1 Tax=Thalictrum thalictroides TaxID=46969 RepID=A0A7J6V3S4_THATH|nr:Major facilitator superfamily protein [Thalictrum thalictroides]